MDAGAGDIDELTSDGKSSAVDMSEGVAVKVGAGVLVGN
jgi:hypothetical protein